MLGTMMNMPLMISSLLRHAANCHSGTEIVSRTTEGPVHRYTYGECWTRTQQLAHALDALGLKPGDRVATLAWNGYRHMEIYYATASTGMVCHTINPRLFPEQIIYIANHAEDAAIFVDLNLLPLVEAIASKLASVKSIVVMTDRAHMPAESKLPNLLCYEELIAGKPTSYDFPEFDENTAAGLCYTSGTTGQPKGVLYSHRSTVLHAISVCTPDVFNLRAADSALVVVPMFHVNGWGMAHAGPLTGCKLVFPSFRMDGASLHEQIIDEGVTRSAGVPTIWMGMLDWIAANKKDLGRLEHVAIGGSACPPVMIEQFRSYGVGVLHAWGMTETSPVCTANNPTNKQAGFSLAEKDKLQIKQGRALYGVQLRVTGSDGKELPRDGKSFGGLQVRGPWITASYFKLDESAAHQDGWFDTGDVVTMDEDGYIQIVDRTKDVIKSGGEWISSIELENIAVGHPAVREAAVVAVPDPKWAERPMLVLVLKPDASVSLAEMQAHFEGKVAKWWVPEQMTIVEELPHTATGKLLKSKIREMVTG